MGHPPHPPEQIAPDTARAPQRSGPRARSVVPGFGFVAVGLVLLVSAAFLDLEAQNRSPWSGALFDPEGPPPWDGAVPIQARRVPLNNFPVQEDIAFRLRDALPPEQYRALAPSNTEWLLSVEMPVERFEPLLASGRLPRPGRPEVLAGVFCRANRIQVEDAQFQVVGRLERGVGGLYAAYVLPAHAVWDGLLMHTASWGWLDPDGREHLLEQENPEVLVEQAGIQGGNAPAPPVVNLLSMAGLLLIAVGGGLLHWAFFVSRAHRTTGWFAPMYRATADHPRLVRGMHVCLYGGFFLMMILAFAFPMGNVLLQDYINHAFTEGELGYVGRAYESGNIPLAAAATWVNNYLFQTVALTVLLSVIVPFAGVLKAWGNFAVAGFGMAPLWSGMPGMLIFHSVTMVLELEAYIFACVAVGLYWNSFLQLSQKFVWPGLAALGLFATNVLVLLVVSTRFDWEILLACAAIFGTAWIAFDRWLHKFADRDGWEQRIRILLAGTVLSGFMLAIAGLYEAATLILLR